MPGYYRICLILTIIECTVAFTIALALWVNLMPLWMTLPEAEHLNTYEKYVTSGYGFWGAMWAIPNYVMLKTADTGVLRLWARLAAGMYLLWWIFWLPQVLNGTWQWYAMLAYVPLRLYQLGAHLVYGFRPQS